MALALFDVLLLACLFFSIFLALEVLCLCDKLKVERRNT